MKITRYTIFILLLILLVSSCKRRPLEDEMGDLARVPIHIDWSQSELDVTKVHNVSIWFFPYDGSPSFEQRFDGNLTDMEVLLPSGSYSIIVFNEAVDFSWSSLEFLDRDKYATFRVAARAGTFRGLDSRVEVSDIRKSPDALASWSKDCFVVSPEMIYATAMDSRVEDIDPSHRIDVTMKPITKAVKITAYVQNLTSAARCSGTISGVTSSILLSTGEVYSNNVAHVFIMNNRIYDTNKPNDGYIHANFFIFRRTDEGKKVLQIDFELTDGKFESPEPFDITKHIFPIQPQVDVNVGTGVDGDEENHPIVLPDAKVNSDVGVDNWQNEIIPIT